MDFLSTELGCVYFRCIIYKYICAVKDVFCFHLIFTKHKKGTGSSTHPEGWVVRSFPVRLFAESQLVDLSSCFLRLGFVQSCVGRLHTFLLNNTSVHCTKDWTLLKECSVIPGDSPELLTASMCQPRFQQQFIEQSLSKGSYFSNILRVQQRF